MPIVFLFALLPMIAFCLLFLLLLARQPQQVSGPAAWQEPLIQTVLFWSAFLVLGTELLNMVKGLTTAGIILLWLGALFGLAYLHWTGKSLLPGWGRFISVFKQLRLGWFDRLALAVILAALLILLITGLMSPPNIHDVLAYHMSRVMHWVQNQSLAYYPTTITWQLWMPPFSEFSQLHWQLLTGGDVLASLHQWYHLVFIMAAVSATVGLLGVRKRGQILSAMFILTVPIVVLQASGAKNDIVLSFFIAALLYYVVKAAVAELSYVDWVAAGISVALGVLTKGTFSFFALPLLAWLLISMLKKAGWKNALMFAAIGLVLVLLFNGAHWMRNTRTFGSPFTSEERSSLMNSRFGASVTLSNLSRHAVVQMNGKYGIVNETLMIAVEGIHQWLDMDLFDPGITLGPREFYYVPTREEVAGNPFHFAITGLLVLLCVFGLINKKFRSEAYLVMILSGVALAGAILFSAAFRWQAWSTRFFIPYYVLFSPVFGYYLASAHL
jgi:4-amino-4-deoxy-L-arabinose transferase-like glycosyltransferase